MAALKIFGKKDEKAKKPTKAKDDVSKKKEVKNEQVPDTASKAQEKVQTSVVASEYIVRPHITEKATDLAAQNRYVFVVTPNAAKKEVQYAVEKMYGVKVEGVRIINVHPKKMRLGRTRGVKKGYKKAIVQIKEGQSIDVLPS